MADEMAFGGRATEVFAGLPVRDFKASLEWYQRLFGCPPSFFPNDREAVWALAEHRWLYIIVDEKRAGGAVQTVICTDLDTTIAEIAGRGIDFVDEERPGEGVRKVMYNDPDGNEVGIGSLPTE